MDGPAEARATAEPAEAAALRERLLTALAEVIYSPDATLAGGREPLTLHHTGLRRRSAAVELIGRFPDAGAVALLAELLLRQGRARTLPGPLWRWLRDTALLTLLRSTRLPRRQVDWTLGRLYGIWRYPLPWQWSAVYDDLPLLARYGKQGVFFRAFWLWPLLVGAIPTLLLIGQLLWPGYLPPNPLRTLGVVVGSGLEIYLVHQVLIAMLSGAGGPLLEVVGAGSIRWKAGAAGIVALLLIGVIAGLMVSGSFQVAGAEGVAGGSLGLWVAALVLPLLLPPLFILAHDLERMVRYAPRRHGWGVRLWTVVLRRATDGLYILALPVIAGLMWPTERANWLPVAILVFLVYLFAVPLLVAGGGRVLSRGGHGGRPRGAEEQAGSGGG